MCGLGKEVNPVPKRKRITDRKYLRFVRQQGCVLSVDKAPCMEAVDAHHVKPVGGGIMGGKVSDYRAVGLCRLHHDLAHNYPVSCREHLESAIRRLRKDYLALHPPKPVKEKPRILKPKIEFITIRCSCGLRHLPSKNQYTIEVEGLRFWCRKKKDYLTAEL